jgi:hypothetical protein
MKIVRRRPHVYKILTTDTRQLRFETPVWRVGGPNNRTITVRQVHSRQHRVERRHGPRGEIASLEREADLRDGGTAMTPAAEA